MQENPLEEQRIKINSIREKLRHDLGHFFDEKDRIKKRAEDFILRLDDYEKSGLVFNKEEIIRGIKEGILIQDKDAFIDHLVRVLEPLTILQVTHSKIFKDIEERVSREQTINNSDTLRLSEVLYVDFNKERADIHLASAKDFITKEKIGNFKQEIRKGLVKLAEIIQSYPNIKEIWASSWIVAKSPKRLEELGFIIVGPISEEEKKKHFAGEERPVAKAFMTREDFLARYDMAILHNHSSNTIH